MLVVLALLTLFTIVGITFVYMSDSYALSARVARDAQNVWRPDIEPELAFSYFLGQLIYDVNDDSTSGIHSSLRGHSLGRNMYGWNHNLDTVYLSNELPYSGVGRLRLAPPQPFLGLVNPFSTFPYTEQDLINYKYFPNDGFLRDPERLGARTGPTAARGNFFCSAVPYTYADNNSAFLAVLDPTQNQIVVPSFHRPWLFGNLADPTNPNWTNPIGKYLTPRPRPQEHPAFALPTDPGGDVKNYDGGAGGNDSIWMDINAPVLRAPNGQLYKMLAAPLVLELDSRVNLNVHGNILGNVNGIPAHAGNQGWGPWEVNLGKVFPNSEWRNLLLGNPPGRNPAAPPRVQGKYGPGLPGTQGYLPLLPANVPTPGTFTATMPRGWAMTDGNGLIDPTQAGAGSATGPWYLPGNVLNPIDPVGISPFPIFPSAGFSNGGPLETTSTGQPVGQGQPPAIFTHPLAYNALAPAQGNRLLPLLDTVALVRRGGTNAEFLSCNTTQLCPIAFSVYPSLSRLVTTSSFDLDRPAIVPYIWDRTAQTYALNTTTYPPSILQAALPVNPLTAPLFPNTGAVLTNLRLPALSEFEANPAVPGTTTFRSVLSRLAKLNLNSQLTAYPTPDATGSIDITNAQNTAALTQAAPGSAATGAEHLQSFAAGYRGPRPGR